MVRFLFPESSSRFSNLVARAYTKQKETKGGWSKWCFGREETQTRPRFEADISYHNLL